MNLLAAFDTAVRNQPQKAFIRFEGRSISYREMKKRSQIAASVLTAKGVGAGDAVALMCFNTPAFVEALLGTWRLGAIVVPVNHKLQAPEVEYILRHSSAKVLVFDASLIDVISAVDGPTKALSTGGATQYESFDRLMRETAAIAGKEPDDDGFAEILYTSGTTGKPKGCVLTHRSIARAAITVALVVSMAHDERTLIAMPIWHSSPLNNWFGGTVYVGGTVVLLREYESRRFLETVQAERVTCYFGAPFSYTAPIECDDFDSFDLSSVKAWVYGGGPISVNTVKRLAERYRSNRFYQVYGMTETGLAGTALYPEKQLAHARLPHEPTGKVQKFVMRDMHCGDGANSPAWSRSKPQPWWWPVALGYEPVQSAHTKAGNGSSVTGNTNHGAARHSGPGNHSVGPLSSAIILKKPCGDGI